MIRKFLCLALLMTLATPHTIGQINAGKVKAPNKTTQTTKAKSKTSKPSKGKTARSLSGSVKSKKSTNSGSNSSVQRTEPSNKISSGSTSYTGAEAKYLFRRVGTCPLSDPLNPLDCGIILGWTTVEEAVAAGGKKQQRDDLENCVTLLDRSYWDHDGDGIINSVYITKRSGVPSNLSQAGFDFSLSYNKILSWLSRYGFEAYVIKSPDGSSGSLSAEIVAICKLNHLKMNLDFNYSRKSSVNDENTLYSITLERKRIHTSTTDYAPYFPLEGVYMGITTMNDLRQRGVSIKSFGDYNQFTYGELRGFEFYNDAKCGNTVEKISIRSNELPQAWARNGESRVMTYNKWMQYFADNGFIVIKNEPRDKPDAIYPHIEAINPELGLLFKLDFKKMTLLADGDNPNVFWEFDLETL